MEEKNLDIKIIEVVESLSGITLKDSLLILNCAKNLLLESSTFDSNSEIFQKNKKEML